MESNLVRSKKSTNVNAVVHLGDIPPDLDLGEDIAVDTEAMGLNNHRDRLCVIQLSSGDGAAHLVKFDSDGNYSLLFLSFMNFLFFTQRIIKSDIDECVRCAMT